MKIQAIVLAAGMAFGGSSYAVAPPPITLTPNGGGSLVGSFSANTASSMFTLDLSGLSGTSVVTALVTASNVFTGGFDVTGATFDSTPFTAVTNSSSSSPFGPITVDYWTYQDTVTNAVHTITINGLAFGGSFSGQIGISNTPPPLPPVTPSVPEPETVAMMLAGLGAIGFVARRRRRD